MISTGWSLYICPELALLSFLPWFHYGKYDDEGDDEEEDDGNHHTFSGFLLQALGSVESISSPLHMVYSICHLQVRKKRVLFF